MTRRKDLIPSERVRIDGNRKRGKNAREDKTWAWLDAIPTGQRFDMVWELITGAVNGELGVSSSINLMDIEDEAAQKALQNLLENMVMDEN
jgi:hypothetical protein